MTEKSENTRLNASQRYEEVKIIKKRSEESEKAQHICKIILKGKNKGNEREVVFKEKTAGNFLDLELRHKTLDQNGMQRSSGILEKLQREIQEIKNSTESIYNRLNEDVSLDFEDRIVACNH